MNLNGIVSSRPERAIINVSMRLHNHLCRFDRDHGWEPRLMARVNRNMSLALPIENTGTADRLATDLQKELGFIADTKGTPI
eukprot:5797076-Pleurochrysis_carterae.AAC.1